MRVRGPLTLGFCTSLLCFSAAAQDSAKPDDSLDDLLNAPNITPSSSPQAPAASTSSAPAEKPATQPDQLKQEPDNAPPAADTEPVPVSPDLVPAGTATTTSGARATPRNRFIEEIVVTAQKREESLQSVPVTVNAFSGDFLQAKGIDDPTSLPKITPGLTYNTATAFAIIYLRGIGSDAFLTADPSVATYIDGIYYPFASGQAQSFGQVERIEVLKGPQGTLFGRNTTGGAISVTTETPSTDFKATIGTSYESYNKSNTNVLLSGPISSWLSASVAALYDRTDGYYTYDSGSPIQSLSIDQAIGVRAKLRFMPLDNLDITFGVTKIHQTGAGQVIDPNTGPSPLAKLLGIQPQPRDYTAEANAPNTFLIDNTVYTNQSKWTTSWLDVKALGSFQTLNNVGHNDFDGSKQPIISFSATPLYANVKSAELQLISNQDTWGAKYLEWIVGLYYFDEKAGLVPQLSVLGGESGKILGLPAATTLINELLPSSLQSILSPLQNTISGLPLTSGLNLALSGQVNTRSDAAYGQTTFHATDWLSLTYGARIQHEIRKAVDSTFGLSNGDGSVTPVFNFITNPLFDNTKLRDDPTDFSQKVSVSVTPLDGTLVYASWQKAIKDGTFNIINIYNGVDFAKPEDVYAVEAGFKSEFLDGLVRFNAAAFQTRVENLQVQFVSLLNGGAVSISNAPAARVRGVDFDTVVQLFPSLVDGLVFSAGGEYLKAVYTDYPDGQGFDENSGLYNFGKGDYTGNQIVRSPKYTANVALSKTFDTRWGPLEFATDGYYNSGYYFLAQDSPNFKQNQYYLFNARASFHYDPWKFRVTVFGDNLTGTVYDQGQFPNDFGRLETLASPRTAGLRLTWDY